MVFRQFFSRPHELTKIVLQKFYKIILHQIAPFGLANWTKKVFPVFPRNIPYRARPKGPPFQFYSALWDFFSGKKIFSPKGPPSIFLLFCDRMDVGKSQRVPLSVYFWYCETFFPKFFFHKRVPNSPILWHIEVLLLFLSLRYGADLGRSRLVFTWRRYSNSLYISSRFAVVTFSKVKITQLVWNRRILFAGSYWKCANESWTQ